MAMLRLVLGLYLIIKIPEIQFSVGILSNRFDGLNKADLGRSWKGMNTRLGWCLCAGRQAHNIEQT